MSSSSVITPEDVLESLMNDGTIDALRLKIINQLKANVISNEPLFFSQTKVLILDIAIERAYKVLIFLDICLCKVLIFFFFFCCCCCCCDCKQEELKSTTIKMAEESKVLNTPGAEKQTKRELFDALRQELE